MPGLVPDRLAMGCNRRDVFPRNSGFSHHLDRGISQPTSEVKIESTVLGGSAAAQCRAQSRTLGTGVRARCVSEEIDVDTPIARIAEARYCRTDSVERGARHQTDNDGGSHANPL